MIENEEIIKMSADLIDVYTRIENDLIVNVAKRFSVTDEVTPETVLKWQADKLEQLGALRSENIKIISKYSKKTIAEVKKIMTEAGYTAVKVDEMLYEQAFSRGLFKSVPVPARFSPALQAMLKGAIDNTRTMFNMINTTALESANTQFLKIINQSYLEVSTGLYDYNSAIRKAVRNLADEGITGANYVSAAGRATKNHIDVAVRRAILTSTSQTAAEMQLQRSQAWGNNHVEVSSHAGSRPSHAIFQGKVFMLNGSDSKYQNFYSATGYGSVTGLCGANCAHKFFPFIEGISEQTYHLYDLEENKKQYENSQTQRQLERDIRQQKRRVLTADQIGDKEAKTAAQLKLKAKEAQLKSFVGKTGRTQRSNRQQVMNFNRSQSAQAAWAKRINNNPSSSPTKFFEGKVNNEKTSNTNYKDALRNTFSKGTKNAKTVFAKHVPIDSVADGKYMHTAHYSPTTKRISMNFDADAKNLRGVGVTYYHEHGHLIDYANGIPTSIQNANFRKALQDDYDQYIIEYMKSNKIRLKTDAYNLISQDLKKSDLYSSVSDIIDGISKGKVSGDWGHPKSYWLNDPNKIALESFAHLFEAQFNKSRLKIFKTYFPTASIEFDKMLGGLI